MAKIDLSIVQSNNFDLKNEFVELGPSAERHESRLPAIDALEAMRVDRLALSASKHGLETICGASCDTGAQ
jgi:hypothetical protein